MFLLTRLKNWGIAAKNKIVDAAAYAKQKTINTAAKAKDKVQEGINGIDKIVTENDENDDTGTDTDDDGSGLVDRIASSIRSFASDVRDFLTNSGPMMISKTRDIIPLGIIPTKPKRDAERLFSCLDLAGMRAKGKGAIRLLLGAYTGVTSLACGITWYYADAAWDGTHDRLKSLGTAAAGFVSVFALTMPIRRTVSYLSRSAGAAAASALGGPFGTMAYYGTMSCCYTLTYHTFAWSIEWVYEIVDDTPLQSMLHDFINVGREPGAEETTDRTTNTTQQDIIDVDGNVVQ